MPTYTWPTKWYPQDVQFHPVAISKLSVSPYTGASKAAGQGSIWMCNATFSVRDRLDARHFQAWLDKLEGPINPVWLPIWGSEKIQLFMNDAGEPWSDGTLFSDGTGWSNQSWNAIVAASALSGARTITLADLPPSIKVLFEGDKLGIGESVVEITSDVTADSGGVAMVSFLPGLRKGVIAGTPVVIDSPRVLMRMNTDVDYGLLITPAIAQEVSLSFVEAVDLL